MEAMDQQRRQRRSFTDEHKREVVELCLTSGRSIAGVARDLDLSETAVRRCLSAREPCDDLPIRLVALFLKPWWGAGITGLAIFLIVLFFDFWASIGYLAPITGILVEMGIRHLQGRRQVATEPEIAAVA